MKRKAASLGAVLLMGCALAVPVWGQGPGGGPGGPPDFGGDVRGGGFGGPGFGGGAFARRFAMGNVTAVDAAAGTLTITSQMAGGPETITAGPDAQIVTEAVSSVSELRVGDQVRVTGVPTQIMASQIVAGQLPAGFGAPGGGFGGFGGGGRPGGFNGGGPGAGAQAGASTVTAKVTQTRPLTLVVNDSVTMTVRLAPDAKVSRIKTLALSGVKVGDRVVATGQAGGDGRFSAAMVAVNMNAASLGEFGPGMGRGGFGRRQRFGPGMPGGDGPGMPFPSAPGQDVPFPGGAGPDPKGGMGGPQGGGPMPSPQGPQGGMMPSPSGEGVETQITGGE